MGTKEKGRFYVRVSLSGGPWSELSANIRCPPALLACPTARLGQYCDLSMTMMVLWLEWRCQIMDSVSFYDPRFCAMSIMSHSTHGEEQWWNANSKQNYSAPRSDGLVFNCWHVADRWSDALWRPMWLVAYYHRYVKPSLNNRRIWLYMLCKVN